MEIALGAVELTDLKSRTTTHFQECSSFGVTTPREPDHGTNAPIDIHIKNLSVEVNQDKPIAWKPGKHVKTDGSNTDTAGPPKRILKDVSAHIPGAGLTAIIGSSGSGKTSLLNVMSSRMGTTHLSQSGSVTFSTHAANPVASADHEDIRTAYVMQQDILLPTLSVRETLRYAADLHHSTTKSRTQRMAMVEQTITDLQLTACADTKIGNSTHRGCSGGQKRRTSIGVQLLADPSVLFLDEPTTGLDAASALQVISTLKGLAKGGRTIVMTVHQPRSEIWSLLDNLILMSYGSPLYMGPAHQCLSYFEQQGYTLPQFINPFDFIIDLAAVDVRSKELEHKSLLRVTALQQAWYTRASITSSLDLRQETIGLAARPTRTVQALKVSTLETVVHTRRTILVTCRDRLGLAASLIEALGMGILSGLIFLRLGKDLSGIRSRQGALYSASAMQGYLVLLFETYRLTVDIELFDRERVENVVRPITFVISRRLARLFLEDLAVPLLYSISFYYMAGLRQEASRFLTFFAIQVLLHFIAVNVAMVCVAISRQFMTASLVANLVFTIQAMGSGFFVNVVNMPIWLRWIRWTAYVFYAFGALCTNEFANHFYDCPSPGGPSDPTCKEYTGAYIIASLGLPSNWLARPIFVLLGFVLLVFSLSIILLHLLPHSIEMAKAHKSTADAPSETPVAVTGGNRPTTVTLDQFSLEVETKQVFHKGVRKRICQPISATFKPGLLNAIMGPSGSGKSSCLNAISRRLHSNSRTRYFSSGQILINGCDASDNLVSSITSYVPQDDSGLLPCLTVRETLHFAARLRLPSWMTVDQKILRAESVLLSLGLRDCADTLIGSDTVKGISGGEKRRVTIATQILTDPRVLLLDEPTSGLDAFTALSIIEVLKGLAAEGRTIIFVIHQPRSELFQQFGSVLLLSGRGETAFSGRSGDMVAHFEAQGFKFPEATNPADFALDVVSTDYQAIPQNMASSSEAGSASASSSAIEQMTASNEALVAPAALGAYERSMIPWHSAIPLLVKRSLTNLRRQPDLLAGRVSQLAGLGVVLVAFFTPLRHDYYSVQTRMGYLQQIGSIFFVGMLNSIAMYVQERDIFHQEHADLAYSVESFFLSYTALELPMGLFASFVFSALTVFAVGLPRTASLFLLMTYTTFCVVTCGESFGILFFTIFSHTGLAVSVMSVVLSVAVSLGGVLSTSVPAWLQALNHVSPIKWQIGALASYSMRGVTFTCTEAQRLSDGQCPITTGEQALNLYKLNVSTGKYVLALGGVAVGYRILAYVGLKIRMRR